MAVDKIKPFSHLGDIGYYISKYVEERGYSVVKEFQGHGIGREMHEDPSVPNYGIRGTGIRLKKGMALAIEPMITLGNREVVFESDGWTCRTADYSPAAHMEHDVAITENGPEILSSFDFVNSRSTGRP